MCAPGHDSDSQECTGCLPGYYPEIGNICKQCPPGRSMVDLIVPILLLGVALAVLFGLQVGIVWIVTRREGGTMGGGIRRAVEFTVWVVITLQCFVQVWTRLRQVHPVPPTIRQYTHHTPASTEPPLS